MCGSMVDIQSTAAEIRQGKKERKKEERKTETTAKIQWLALLHRADIINYHLKEEPEVTNNALWPYILSCDYSKETCQNICSVQLY